jgi:hypothetical protein
MMAQPEYLLRNRWRHPATVYQTGQLLVKHPDITRQTHTVAGFPFHEATGKVDHQRLDIRGMRDERTPGLDSIVFRVRRVAADVQTVLRRLRPQEATELDAIDAEIVQLQTALAAAKERRKAALSKAWTRANVVRLHEVEALLPEQAR